MLTKEQKTTITTEGTEAQVVTAVLIADIAKIRPVTRSMTKKVYALNALQIALTLNTAKDFYTDAEEEVMYKAVEKLTRGY